MHQLPEHEEQQQGKAIQLRRRRPPRREDWPLLGPRSVLPMRGPTESECGLCPEGIMGVLVSNNYIMVDAKCIIHSLYSQKDALKGLKATLIQIEGTSRQFHFEQLCISYKSHSFSTIILHSLALLKVCYRPCFLFLAAIINHNHRRRHNSNCGRRLSPLFRELNTEPLTQGRKGKSPPIPNNDLTH